MSSGPPDPPTADQLDHLLSTPYGQFDVVPERSGNYPELARRALLMELDGLTIQVAHPDDLIATMRLHKPKHRARLPFLTGIREKMETGEPVTLRLR